MINGVELFGTDDLILTKDSEAKGAGVEEWPVRRPGTCLATKPLPLQGLRIQTQIGLAYERLLFRTCLAHALAQEIWTIYRSTGTHFEK